MLSQPIAFAYPPQSIAPAPYHFVPSQTAQTFNEIIPVPLKNQPPDPDYAIVTAIIRELRRIPDRDNALHDRIANFDHKCQQLTAIVKTIRPEKVEPMLKYIRFPFPRDGLGEGSLEPMRDSVSLADFAACAGRHVSFAQQIYAEDASDVAERGLWQAKPSQDTTIVSFESGSINDEFAAFSSAGTGSGQSSLTVWRYRGDRTDFTTFDFESTVVIDSLCLAASVAWCLSNATLFIVPFSRFDAPRSVHLPASGAGSVVPFLNGVAVAFSASQSLYWVDALGDVRAIALPFSGVSCMADVSGRLVCGVPGSAAIRLLAPDGTEQRVFVGHCGCVTQVEALSGTLFASFALQDMTVRVWDVRDRAPVLTVLLPDVAVTAIAGSSDYLVCGFKNKRVGVVRLAGDRCSPVVGVQMQEFTPCKMRFDQDTDTLYMFAVRESDQRIGCPDANRGGKQTVFRKYPRLIHTCE
jgi:hypothetical protein